MRFLRFQTKRASMRFSTFLPRLLYVQGGMSWEGPAQREGLGSKFGPVWAPDAPVWGHVVFRDRGQRGRYSEWNYPALLGRCPCAGDLELE
jgi:hypothetical protein